MSSKTEAEQNKLKLPETKVESIMEDHVESNMVRNHSSHKENWLTEKMGVFYYYESDIDWTGQNKVLLPIHRL